MFVRELNTNPVLYMNKIEDALLEKGQIKKVNFNYGVIAKFNIRHFLDLVNKELKMNPNWLIEN